MSNLLGHEVQESKKINELIQQLVSEVQKSSERISGPRPPAEEWKAHGARLVDEVAKVRGRELFYPYIGSGVGRGPYVELEDGSVKLDLINGIGIHLLGHSHPRVMAAMIRGALSDIAIQGNLQPNKEYLRLGEKLVKLAGRKSRLKHVWLTTSGSMANENALKICRQKKSPARMVVAMESAFAGRTTLMAEITDNPAFKVGLPDYHEVLRVPFASTYNTSSCQPECKPGCQGSKDAEVALNRLKEHVANHKNNICAFMFEPMQGEGGYRTACRNFFLPLLQFCREQKIPVWADEVQTFTRTGELFAFEKLGIGEYIDVCTVAKTLQNGATLYTEEFNPQPGLIAGTFSGSSPTLSAGIEVLDILEEEGYFGPQGKIQKIHNEFVGMLNRLNETTCKGLLNDAGGMGLMVAVTPLDGSKETQGKVLKTLFNNGLMSFGCGRGPYRIRFLIPAVMSSQDIAVAEKIIEKSILELA